MLVLFKLTDNWQPIRPAGSDLAGTLTFRLGKPLGLYKITATGSDVTVQAIASCQNLKPKISTLW